MPDYRNLVEYVVRHLVSHPDEVQVIEDRSLPGTTLVKIQVAQDDVGRIIGKHGGTINAIRLLTKAAAIKSGEKVDVDIEEE